MAIRKVVEDGVVFVIAHDGVRIARIDHAPDDLEHSPDGRSPVNVIAKKDDLPSLRVVPSAPGFGVAELEEEGFEGSGMAVDVSYEIVGLSQDWLGCGVAFHG